MTSTNRTDVVLGVRVMFSYPVSFFFLFLFLHASAPTLFVFCTQQLSPERGQNDNSKKTARNIGNQSSLRYKRSEKNKYPIDLHDIC
jgi:hypothetical protein